MHTYRIETTDLREGILNIEGLPLRPGERIEVIIKNPSLERKIQKDPYPLRNQPVTYSRPFDSVAEDEWDV